MSFADQDVDELVAGDRYCAQPILHRLSQLLRHDVRQRFTLARRRQARDQMLTSTMRQEVGQGLLQLRSLLLGVRDQAAAARGRRHHKTRNLSLERTQALDVKTAVPQTNNPSRSSSHNTAPLAAAAPTCSSTPPSMIVCKFARVRSGATSIACGNSAFNACNIGRDLPAFDGPYKQRPLRGRALVLPVVSRGWSCGPTEMVISG